MTNDTPRHAATAMPAPGRLFDMIQQTRQSHALEHATIHVLSRRQPGAQLMGRSTPLGFYVYGNVSTSTIAAAAGEALARLQAGESQLTVHPRCGTNLAVSALFGSIASLLVLRRRRRSIWEELPELFLALTAAWLVAQPAGYSFQEHVTTTPHVQNVRIGAIERQTGSRQTVHRVILERD